MASAASFDPRTAPILFKQKGDWAAVDAAVAALCGAGFSVGRMQAHAPRGLLLGTVDVQKWRNLNQQQRRELDGEMFGGRGGPINIVPTAGASDDVLAAFDRVRWVAASC